MKERNTDIEILRVLSMYMIVVSHYIYHGVKANEVLCSFDVSTWGG